MKLDIVSKHRGAIYGFAILWIVVYHGWKVNNIDYTLGHRSLEFIKTIVSTGNVGVDIFLFLSGVCLYFSFVRKPDVMAFMKNRFMRVVPGVLLIFIGWWVYLSLINTVDVPTFVSRVMLVRFWMTGDRTIWFVSLILVLYLAYPLIYYYFFSDDKHQARKLVVLLLTLYILCLLLQATNEELYNNWEVALTRVPVFVFGCWFGKYVYEKRQVHVGWAVVAIVAVIAFFVVCHLHLIKTPWIRFVYGLAGVALSYALALLFQAFERLSIRPLYRFLTWTGGFTLELYCTQGMMDQILRQLPFYADGSFVQYYVMAAIAFFAAWLVMKIVTLASKRLSKPS